MADDKYAEARALAERGVANGERWGIEGNAISTVCRALLSALAEVEARENLLAYVGGLMVADVDDSCVPTEEQINAAHLRRCNERTTLEAARDSALRERDEARRIIDTTRETAVRAVSSWGLATGHADTLDDLLSHVGEQVAELIASRAALAGALRKVQAHYTDTEGASLPYELSCEIQAALGGEAAS